MRQKAARKLEVKGEFQIFMGYSKSEKNHTHTKVMFLGQADSGKRNEEETHTKEI